MNMKMPMDLRGSDNFYPMVNEGSPDDRGPTVNFSWEEDYGFPDEGVMTVKFRVKRREEEIDSEGEKVYHVSLELLEIQKMKATECCSPASSHDEAGKALDKLKSEMGY